MNLRGFAAIFAGLALGAALLPTTALASSHREAPLIAQDPEADNTDTYAFVAPDNPGDVVIVGDWIPFIKPDNGPNFSFFAPDVLYQLHVDNVGDGKSHLSFNFRFEQKTRDGNTFLYNEPLDNSSGKITFQNGKYLNWNRPETYDVSMTNSDADNTGDDTYGTHDSNDTKVLGRDLLTPPDAVGPRSTGSASDYHKLASAAVHNLGNDVTVFAGLRADPFFVNVGGVFDLLRVCGCASDPGAIDTLKGLNTRSIAIRVPKSLLEGPNGDHIIGVWATSSRHKETVLHSDGTKTGSGGWQQVSRLANPLANELFIGLKDKDNFNATHPADDSRFANRFTSPLPVVLLNLIFKGVINAPTTDRDDLEAVFLTGIPGLNKPAKSSALAEEMRLNMSIRPSHKDPNDDNRLGVLAGEADGFPNGRRLADDTVDIEIQAAAGATCVAVPGSCPSKPSLGGNKNPTVKDFAGLGDGIPHSQKKFQDQFPYLADPNFVSAGSPSK